MLISTSYSGSKQVTFLYFCCQPSQLLLSFMESSVGTPQSVASQKLLHPPGDFKRSKSQRGVGSLSNVSFSCISCLSSLICYSFIPQGSLYPSVGNILLLLCVSAQSRLTLCDPMNCSLPGSSVHGIIQARRLEQVTISFSRGSSWTGDRTLVSCTGRCFLYHLSHQGSCKFSYIIW